MLLSDAFGGKTGIMVGQIYPFAGSIAPAGYLMCSGAAISRTIFKTLFDSIGATFGAGDGSTTFNLPNSAGLFLQGAGSQLVTSKTFNGGAVGAKSAHVTAVNGITCGTACTPTVALNPASLAHTHGLSDLYGSGGLDVIWGNPSPTQFLIQTAATSNQADSTNPALSSHNHTATYNVAHVTTLTSTDTETAPAALSLNFIIKY
jgi:microcystin-dependent protein